MFQLKLRVLRTLIYYANLLVNIARLICLLLVYYIIFIHVPAL